METIQARPKCATIGCDKPARKRIKRRGGFDKLCESCHSKRYRRTKQKWSPRLNELRKIGITRSPRRFLVIVLSHIKARCERKPALGLCTITINDLIDLWDKQNGRCAITNLIMEHKPNKLKTVSVDRIDSNIGYTAGNIQLVCKFINLGKSTHSNDEVITLLNELYIIHARA